MQVAGDLASLRLVSTVTTWLSWVCNISAPPPRCCILACSAYVGLALGDNLMALTHAEKLLHQAKVSGSLK